MVVKTKQSILWAIKFNLTQKSAQLMDIPAQRFFTLGACGKDSLLIFVSSRSTKERYNFIFKPTISNITMMNHYC